MAAFNLGKLHFAALCICKLILKSASLQAVCGLKGSLSRGILVIAAYLDGRCRGSGRGPHPSQRLLSIPSSSMEAAKASIGIWMPGKGACQQAAVSCLQDLQPAGKIVALDKTLNVRSYM